MQSCAFCGSHTTEVMHFGDVALAGGFLREEGFAAERKYPLSLAFCEECFLLQVPQRVDPVTMFGDYFYFSSAIGTLRTHFAQYAGEIVERFAPQTVVEIGCNDGVMLKPLADLGVKRLVGVDPASNVTAAINDPRIEVVNACFGKGVVPGSADVVIANNVFAHIADVNGATEAIAKLIGKTGVFVFEVNRLDSMIADLQYDWVYHEHLFYYSSLALSRHFERHGLEIFDLKRIGTHAGSIRYYVAKKGARPQSVRVEEQRDKDLWHGLNSVDRFHRFADDARAHRDELRALVGEARGRGDTVAGYGACGRANTMLQFCGLGAEDVAYIVDDAPAKHGFYTPGSHIPIRPSAALAEQPETLIVFAWSFLPEIMGRCADYRGEMVIPLPHIYKSSERLAA